MERRVHDKSQWENHSAGPWGSAPRRCHFYEELYISIVLCPGRNRMFENKWPCIQDFHHELGSVSYTFIRQAAQEIYQNTEMEYLRRNPSRIRENKHAAGEPSASISTLTNGHTKDRSSLSAVLVHHPHGLLFSWPLHSSVPPPHSMHSSTMLVPPFGKGKRREGKRLEGQGREGVKGIYKSKDKKEEKGLILW